MATIEGTSVLITGGNRGIGRALVEEALLRNAARVYVGARGPYAHSDPRVVPVVLDVTDAEQVRFVAEGINELDILINNAGVAEFDDLSERAAIERHLEVNLYGTHAVTRAFLPHLTAAKGVVVNNLSVNAVAPLVFTPAYSVSKAAAFSLTQSLRVLLAERGVRVQAVLTGATDTDMSRAAPIPKASPESVASAVFDGIEDEAEDIFPDPQAAELAEGWHEGAVKSLERRQLALVASVQRAASS